MRPPITEKQALSHPVASTAIDTLAQTAYELQEQNKQLLDALKTIQFTSPCVYSKNIARAAIAQVEGKQ